MVDKEMLEALRSILQEALEPIKADIVELKQGQSELKKGQSDLASRMDSLQTDIEQIKEDTEITRIAANTLTEWVDRASEVVEIRFPLKR